MIQAASGSLFYLENYLDERAQESLMLRSYFTCYIFQSRPIPLPFHEMNYFVALQFHQMNRVFLVLVLFAVSCGSQTENQKDEAEPVPVYYPFSPRMDVDFEKGIKNMPIRSWISGVDISRETSVALSNTLLIVLACIYLINCCRGKERTSWKSTRIKEQGWQSCRPMWNTGSLFW